MDDDSFGGSNEECRIFKETFLGNGSHDPIPNIKPQSDKCTNTDVATSCEHPSLLSVKDVVLKDSSNARGSSKSRNSKCMKSSVSQGVHEKTCSENVLNPLVVQIESASTVVHPSSDSSCPQDTFRILEYSLFNGPSSSRNSVVSTAAAEPSIDLSGEGYGQQKDVSNLEDNGLKESIPIKQVTSPTSQESTGSKALAVDCSNSKSSIKESQEDEDQFSDASLDDTRDRLTDVVTRLMEAKGWHIEVMQRNCRAYKEKFYISDTGKRVREFPKLWRLLGRSLSVNDSPGVVENTDKCWTNLGHFCSDLSLTLAQNDFTINPTDTDSELACIWNIIDPFVHLIHFDRKLVALRKGTAVRALRSIPHNAFVKNNGDLTFVKLDSVQKKNPQNKKKIQLDSVLKKNPRNKRKIQPSDSSIAADNAIVIQQENDANQNENAGSGRISIFGEMLGEGSNPQKRKNARSECRVTSREGDTGKFKDARQRGDAKPSIFEKVTGMDGSLFRSSLYEVHADSIKEWGSQNGLAERIKAVDNMPADNLENHIGVGTLVSHHSNNKEALLDFSGHKMLQPSGISLAEKEFLDSSNIAPSEDPSVKFKILNGSVKEPENNVSSLHNVAVIWKEQEDLAYGKQTVEEVDMVTVALDSNYTGAVNEGRSFGRSKQIGGQMADDDMLLSAIKKKTKKRRCPFKGESMSNLKVRNVKKKVKGRGRGRPRSGGKGGHQLGSEKCISEGTRTPLSWLIDSGVMHLDATILYHKPQSNDVVKKGFLTKDGILCYCCNEVFSVSKFRLHAGAKSPEACSNLILECGKPYSLFQLNGWSTEYLKRKNHKKLTREEDDQSDDICGLCGDGGDLVCCDKCPATFHQNCLSAQEIPEGDWYCFSCTCHICGEFSRAGTTKRLKCAQCERNYHAACLEDKNMIQVATDDWFCSELCHKVYSDTRSRIGMVVSIANGYSSTLLRCVHDDDNSSFEMPIAFKADCNTKLAVALTIMEECFLSMVDFRTGIDMIPHMVYNFGSNFPRMNFHGFYTVILEKDDAVLCVATLRIHGSSIAEIPLVATCNKYRRQGMCRLLMGAIEEMLRSLKIYEIVMSAVPELVPTWVKGFGFQPVEDEEKARLKTLNLVVFPGTVSLQKSLLQTDQKNKSPNQRIPIPKPVPGTNALQPSDRHPLSSEPDTTNPGSNVVVK